jgi:hypothetical protein
MMAKKPSAFTMAGSDGRFKKLPSDPLVLLKVKDRASGLFRKAARGSIFVVCMDFSWNNQAAIGLEDHWQVHFHGVAFGLKKAGRDKIVKSLKKGDDPSYRPLVVKKLTNPAGYLGYMAKSEFCERISYIDDRGRRNTRIQPLSIEREVALAQWLYPLKANQRLFTVGNTDNLPSLVRGYHK